MNKFWKILDERLELCHRALRCRHERLKGTVSDVAPILWQYGALARLRKGETIDKLLYNNYSTISLGYAGLYEMCMRMTGKSHTDPEAKPFALKVMQHLNDKCAEWRKAENISYSLYGTPMESTTYKFAKCLQKRFGIIKDVTDKNYITNSYHVHVSEKIDAFRKLQFEADFQKLSPGGAISYVEVPNMQNNIPAVLSIMKFIYDNIMYAELNTKSDYCEVCGYDGEIKIRENENGKLVWECPNCGNRDQSKMFVARRTCGYIGTQFWNQGRTQEIRDRVLHSLSELLPVFPDCGARILPVPVPLPEILACRSVLLLLCLRRHPLCPAPSGIHSFYLPCGNCPGTERIRETSRKMRGICRSAAGESRGRGDGPGGSKGGADACRFLPLSPFRCPQPVQVQSGAGFLCDAGRHFLLHL